MIDFGGLVNEIFVSAGWFGKCEVDEILGGMF